jgi:hypothetical protein
MVGDRARIVLVVAGIVVAFCGVLLFGRAMDKLLYPWDDAANGPTLTGTWVGELRTGRGKPRAVLLDMHRWHPKRAGRCSGCATIEGTAMTCDERGQQWRYRAGGKSGDRHATALLVGMSPTADPPPDGLELSSVRGRWAGDSLHLEAEFHWRKGKSTITDSSDPDTRGWLSLPMVRGTESDFRARCARIAVR